MSISTRFSRLSLFVFGIAFCATQVAAFTQCYYPDGSIPLDYIWEPCVGTGHSSCCIPTEGDICQPNGLCYYPSSNNTFRGACTDRTWNDPACPKDICVSGNEDTWAWSSPCYDNTTNTPAVSPIPSPKSYACGTVESARKVTGLCSATLATYYDYFQTTSTTTSKATRYTPPPTLDTAKYTIYTETYSTVISAWVQTTTLTTTWESTFTSALGQVSGTASAAKGSISSATRGSASSTGVGDLSFAPTGTTPPNSSNNISLSPGTLGAAIGVPVVSVALIAFLIFFLRRRKAKGSHDSTGSERLGSSLAGAPPSNGPVGAAQLAPYEAPANEASVGNLSNRAPAYTGAYAPEKGRYEASSHEIYEMSTSPTGEKGWNHGLAVAASDVSANTSPRTQHSTVGTIGNGVLSPVSPGSPQSRFAGAGGGYGVVELDGGHGNGQWQPPQQQQPPLPPKPLGSNRSGVGNA